MQDLTSSEVQECYDPQIPTSKIHKKFNKSPKNMNQSGLNIESKWVFSKIGFEKQMTGGLQPL